MMNILAMFKVSLGERFPFENIDFSLIFFMDFQILLKSFLFLTNFFDQSWIAFSLTNG